MADTIKDTDAQAPVVATPAAPVAAVTPTPPTPPAVAVVLASTNITTQGEANGLPPAAPEVALQPPDEVLKLREWFHEHIKNSVHSQDTPHYNALYNLVESLAAKLHSKYPLAKNDLNPIAKDA